MGGCGPPGGETGPHCYPDKKAAPGRSEAEETHNPHSFRPGEPRAQTRPGRSGLPQSTGSCCSVPPTARRNSCSFPCRSSSRCHTISAPRTAAGRSHACSRLEAAVHAVLTVRRTARSRLTGQGAVPGRPGPGCFVLVPNFGLSTSVQPTTPAHNKAPSPANSLPIRPPRNPCDITAPPPNDTATNRIRAGRNGFFRLIWGHNGKRHANQADLKCRVSWILSEPGA